MKQLLILSGKGGTGKTTTAAAMIRFSKAEAIADCDVDAPNLHLVTATEEEPEEKVFTGAEKAVIDEQKCIGCGACMKVCRFDAIEKEGGKYRVKEYACEGCGVCEYVCREQAVSMKEDEAGKRFLYRGNPFFSTASLRMGRGNSGKLVTAVKMDMIKEAEADLAVIDGSPGIGCPVIASVTGVDLVLIVSEPSISGISDLSRIVKTTSILQTKTAVCVNKYDTSPENTEKIKAFCKEQKIPYVGEIPYDKTAQKAVNAGKSIAEYDCPARDALFLIYKETMKLLNESQTA